jgi:uncharacterized protein YfiM (DUF2279 family)
MMKKILVFITIVLFSIPNSKAQLISEQQPISDSSKIHRGRFIFVTGTTSALYVGMMGYLQFVWYKDKERVPFHFYNDSKGYLQMDKMGHAFGAYAQSYIGYNGLRWTGVSKKNALIYGGSLGFWMQLPIEIWDGMYEGWGFSWPDVYANTAGAALVVSQALIFDDQPIKYKFSFSPTPYAQQANGYLGTGFNQLFNDYNGHTYWLSFGLHHLMPNTGLPKWLNLAVGYSAGGMFGEFENRAFYRGVAIPQTQRYRQFLLSLDIDWTQIEVRQKWLRWILQSMFVVKLPFPALEFNTKGEWRTHGIYY